MKTLILSSLIFSLLFLSASNSYSNPLNGTYTVGNGGNYPTINSAIDDAHLQGLSGPVIFEIIPGIYYDSIVISGKFINIYGDDFFSVTFRPRLSYSPANNYVMITGGISISGSTNIYIEDLSFDSDVNVEGKDIFYINNDFNGHSFTAHYYPINPNNEHNCNLIDNKNLMDVSFEHLYKITVNNNFISGKLKFFSCRVGTIENNVIDNGIFAESVWWYFTLSKNKINGNVVFLNLWTSWVFCSFYNNFITGSVIADEGRFINNTIINNSADTSTVFMESPPLYIANNIFINKAGGNVVNYRYWGGYTPFIDYNLYYNYSNDSLIQYSTSGLYNATFDNVPDFYNLSGFDEHSTSVPVSFVSPADLHLAASSYGDYGLIGIPNTLITDDIDGELRNSLYPYKGADEILDFPLPVELSLFSSSVNENDVILNWVTTSELNNSGFDIERSKVNASDNEWLKIGFVKGNGTSSNTNTYEYTDKNVNSGKYNYRLKQIDFNGNFKYYNLSEEVTVGIPGKYSLNQNFPNPFNPETIISYQIPSDHNVLIKIYDISGKEVLTLVNEYEVAGSYEIKFNGSNFASGIYYYQIEAGEFKATKKMLLVK